MAFQCMSYFRLSKSTMSIDCIRLPSFPIEFHRKVVLHLCVWLLSFIYCSKLLTTKPIQVTVV